MSNNPILEFIERYAHIQNDYPIPEVPKWDIPSHVPYRITWDKRSCSQGEMYTLEKIRPIVREHILDYANSGDNEEMLLCRVPPGIGKTTGSVQAIQEWARETGGRALYVSSRKNFWPELEMIHDFDPGMWWNWLPIDQHTCRYAEQIRVWMDKGQKGIDFCKQFCLMDGHINECPYRRQKDRPEPIIFGRHAHLVYGMSISDYDIGICDEMPLSAFIDIKRIPVESVIPEGAEGYFKQLFNGIYHICANIATKKRYIKGPDLFRYLGDTLTSLFSTYQDVEMLADYAPPGVFLDNPDQVYGMDNYYVFKFLEKLLPEYLCWRNGWGDWLSRVTLSPAGITLYGTKPPQPRWRGMEGVDHVPQKLVGLDASGAPDMYQRLFSRPVDLYAPDIKRAGKVFQVTGRLNGTGTVVREKKDLTKRGQELLEQCKLIAAQYAGRVGIVTFKAIEGMFRQEFGDENVLHYGAIRGSNLFESCECLILAGGYCPNLFGVYNLAMCLNDRRMKPYVRRDKNGVYHNPWVEKQVEYVIKTGDLSAFRPLRGFWQDNDLGLLLDELRTNEMWQAVHRNRILAYPDHHVWVLTSINTPEPLDGIYNDLSEVDFTPDRVNLDGRYEGINWRQWLKIHKWLKTWDKNTITVHDLAEAAGVTVQTVRSQRWVYYLDRFFDRQGAGWAANSLKRIETDRKKQKMLEREV